MPILRVKDNLKLLWRKHKWAFQRMYRGYSDYDVWNLDSYLSEFLAATIEHLANTTHGYPGNEEFPTPESWDAYLRIMAAEFKMYNADLANKYDGAIEFLHLDHENIADVYKNKMWQCYFEVEKQNEKIKTDNLNDALDRLKHVYPNLWD